ncbi:alkaline phosphatase PafA [Pontibacter indicus]|uniref:Type I phosphodiesterase / nucleotide pyrophosphatase n=1 Tax=Pontibacter indicus TaxID=1317125 RepID=A0A1R3XPR5_9BACT|nr:alkaline phosphatase PafA [Pontibacter indicus]SIT93936.1 Type I phosphodiesterase / nucleotide pyrophosphatase [Pontibacter indicus]
MTSFFRVLATLCLVIAGMTVYAGSPPKLVVGLVIDQMRWDHLHRYQDRYGKDGFNRLLRKGHSFNNTFINYVPSMTAVGHASIYTGSVPAIHGIAGNEWFDLKSERMVYCTDDSTTHLVGGEEALPSMSPRQLLTTTWTDELMLASNFRSKVVGVSLKDRAAILPAGHKPTGAFWYDDKSGQFVTSSWYFQDLPTWVEKFNSRQLGQQLLAHEWETLYPAASYGQSTDDQAAWERPFKGAQTTRFPHQVKHLYQTDKGIIRNTPMGNTLILEFAKSAIESYRLGAGAFTDVIAINCASTDYIGHQFGPNSMEVEDAYLRLDQDLASFFKYLDKKIGADNYLVVLTADHGAAQSIGYLESLRFPTGWLRGKEKVKPLNELLAKRFQTDDLVKAIYNYQVYFDMAKIAAAGLDFQAIKAHAIGYLRQEPGVQFVGDMDNASQLSIPEPIRSMMVNGYHFKRSGQLMIIQEPGWFDGPLKGTTHGTWNPADTQIPLIFMGWKIKAGHSNERVHITDIAPTLSWLLNLQAPSGSIGKALHVQLKSD